MFAVVCLLMLAVSTHGYGGVYRENGGGEYGGKNGGWYNEGGYAEGSEWGSGRVVPRRRVVHHTGLRRVLPVATTVIHHGGRFAEHGHGHVHVVSPAISTVSHVHHRHAIRAPASPRVVVVRTESGSRRRRRRGHSEFRGNNKYASKARKYARKGNMHKARKYYRKSKGRRHKHSGSGSGSW